ncbi:MAG: hypothetical protein GY810_16840 [Aureispira sp.]|nr:hypothetical protein [Aureispira sp.]
MSAYSQSNYETTDTSIIHIGEELLVACNDEQCDIFFKNEKIDSVFSDYYAHAKEVLTSLEVFGIPNLFIYKDYHGEGCPEAYHLLAMIDAEDNGPTTYKLVGFFGNCGTLSKIHIKKDGDLVEFQFKEDKEAERRKVTYLYDCKTFELKED